VNRVAVHQSVLAPADPVACVIAARAGGVDSVGLHVASVAEAERTWGRGEGSPVLAALIDALLVTRVTALDVGRIDLADTEGADPTDPAGARHRALDLATRLGAQFVTARAGTTGGNGAAGARATADAFAELCEQARPFRVRPLLVPTPGTTVSTARAALAAAGGTRGGIVLDVDPAVADPEEVAQLVVEAGDALGYVRVAAAALRPDMGPATSLLATVPPQVPLVIGTLGDVDPAVGAGGDAAPVDVVAPGRDGAFLASCRLGVDRLLVHPRAVAAERGRAVGPVTAP
jgi:hypothetical protein